MLSSLSSNSPKDYDRDQVCTIGILSELEILLFDCEIHLPKSTEAVSRSDNEHPSNGPSEGKKASRWVGVKKLLSVLKFMNAAAKRVSYDCGGSQGGESRTQNQSEAGVIRRLCSVVGQMKTLFKDPNQFKNHCDEAKQLVVLANELKATLKKRGSMEFGSSGFIEEINKTSKGIFELKLKILGTLRDLYLPGLHESTNFLKSSALEEVIEKFRYLDYLHMRCLLCFAVFPENSKVKKTMLMYWWIGEDFFSAEGAEERATKILEEFSKQGLIEPVRDDRKLKPNSYKMEPYVHSAVICLAQEVGFFDIYKRKNGKPFMAKSEKQKVCLVEGSSSQQEAKVSKMNDLKSVETVFNTSERFPDFTFKWFPEMHSLKVLYLGRWERTPKRHIEVESTKFLKNIKTMKELRLVSFQGMSRIEKLDNSICQLPQLVILDLRSCYNLEVLPDEIDSLENLIYLDVSECYMLDRMPKEIAVLSKLQVLKGFVVSDADEESCCTLSHLKHMQSLRKLSINISKSSLEVNKLMDSLEKLTKLESLKIAWGAQSRKDKKEKEKRGDPSTDIKLKSMSEKDKDHGDNKGETSKEKKGDADEKGKPQTEPKDAVQNKKEDDKESNKMQMKGDGKFEKVDLEESKERDGEDGKTQKSDQVVEEDKKVNPSQEPKPIIQKKLDDPKVDSEEKKKEDGKKEVDQGESKERGEIEAENPKSDKIVEEDKKANPSQEPKPMIQKKLDDLKGDIKEKKKEDGEKEVDREESKKDGGVEAETRKSDKIVEEDKKMSASQEPKATAQKEPDDLKGDNAIVENAAVKSLDSGIDKKGVSEIEEIHDAAPTSKIKQTTAKRTESSDALFSTCMFPKLKGKGKKKQEDTKKDSLKFPGLKKLELECFPEEQPPSWLNPQVLENLKKLSIRGGKLNRISDQTPSTKNKWRIEVVRLKYLDEFKAEWKELQALFPSMILLEKYKCPKVTFCPTDGNGVWRSQP